MVLTASTVDFQFCAPIHEEVKNLGATVGSHGLMTKRILTGLVLLGILVAAAGCHTVRGIGRDLSEVGDAITEAAGGRP